MRHFYYTVFYFFLFLQCQSSSIASLNVESEPQVISFKGVSIYPDEKVKNLDQNPFDKIISVSDLTTKVQKMIRQEEQSQVYLNLELCSVDNETLVELKKHLFSEPTVTEKLSVIDLSYGTFGRESSIYLKEILEIPNLKFMKLTGTCFSLKNILYLLRDIKRESGEEHVLALSKKIIFLGKSYVKKAKSSVGIYKKMEQSHLLSPDWDQCHFHFYKECFSHLSREPVEVSLSEALKHLSLRTA